MVLEVQAPDEDLANRIQPELSRIHRQYLESIIERCCSELSAPDRIHRVDRLEIDLGTIDFKRFDHDLPDKLKSAMRTALANAIGKQDSESYRQNQDPAATSQLELIAFFAATGTLPWWADSFNPRLVPETLDALLASAPDRLVELLQTIVREREQLVRIVLHASDETLSGLVLALASSSPVSVSAVQQQTEAIIGTWPYVSRHVSGKEAARARNCFWMALIHQTATAASSSESSLWEQVFAEIETQAHDAYLLLVTGMVRSARAPEENVSVPLIFLLSIVADNRQSRVFIKLPVDLQAEIIHSVAEQRNTRLEKIREQVSEADSIHPAAEATPAKRLHRPDLHLDLIFGDADTVYIENSGLVILWPFLPRFFEQLDTR